MKSIDAAGISAFLIPRRAYPLGIMPGKNTLPTKRNMSQGNKKYTNRYGNERGIYLHNKSILRKTAMVCALCGMPLDKSLKYPHPLSVSIDHVIPIALGGRSTLDNLQATHLICNKEKGKRLLSDPKSDQKNENIGQKMKTMDSSLPQYLDWTKY